MADKPQFTPIQSSMLIGHAYDPNSRVLTVQFKNGAVHQYDDVGADKFETFVGNQSPGRYFNSKIKPNHAGRKVSE